MLERTIYPCGVQGDAFARLPRRPRDRVTVAYVGRVTVAKGAELACRALARLRSVHGIDADLLMAGPCAPPMRQRLETVARGLGIEQHLRLLGPLERAAVGELLQQAHAVVVPSIEHDAFGNVCIEAALARAPIVASRIGGILEAPATGRTRCSSSPATPRSVPQRWRRRSATHRPLNAEAWRQDYNREHPHSALGMKSPAAFAVAWAAAA